MEASTFDPQFYKSVPGIVAATLIFVQIIKRALGNVSGLKNVPTWCYSALVALVLTFAASYYGVLTLGDDETVFDKVILAVGLAAVASGFWSWLSEPTDPLKESTLARKSSGLLVLALLVPFTVGCGATTQANARHTAVVIDTGVAEAIFAVQDVEKAVYAAGVVDAAWHKEFNVRLVPLLETGQRFNRLIRAWDPSQPMPKEIRELVPQFKTMLDHVVNSVIKDDGAKSRLLEKIAIAQAAVLAALSFLPQTPEVLEIITSLGA
jgi:hypothetical protein